MADIVYTRPYPGGFRNKPSTSTPINARVAQAFDDGIANATAQANLALQTALEALAAISNGAGSGGGSGGTGTTTTQLGALPTGTASYAAPTGAVFADAVNGNDGTGAGTQASPFKTLGKAIGSQTGTFTVVLRAGTYNENVFVPSGTTPTIQAYPGEAVYLDGSAVVTGWTQSGSTWVKSGFTFARTIETSTDRIDTTNYPNSGDPLVVTYDGAVLTKVASGTTPTAGQFSINDTTHTLTIAQNPTGHEVRASNQKFAIVASSGASLLGIEVRRYASDNTDGQNAPVYITGGAGLIENCTIRQNGRAGIAFFNATNLVIRYNNIEDQAYVGINGDHFTGVQITDNVLLRNNTQRWKAGPSNNPIKVTRGSDITIARNDIENNYRVGAIWTDISVKSPKIYSNRCIMDSGDPANYGAVGILCEESGQGFIADNYVRGYGYGIVARESDHMRIFNNDCDQAAFYTIALVRDDRDGQNATGGSAGEYLQGNYPAGVPWQAINCTMANNKVAGSPQYFAVGCDDEYGGDGWQTGTDMQVTINGNWIVASNVGWANSTGTQNSCTTSAQLNSTASASWTNQFGAATPADSIAVVLPDDIADAVGVARGTQKVGKLT